MKWWGVHALENYSVNKGLSHTFLVTVANKFFEVQSPWKGNAQIFLFFFKLEMNQTSFSATP